MIQEFINRFMAAKGSLESKFALKHPESYEEIVRAVIASITRGYGDPDPNRIHCINDGDYQGTLLFVIAAKDYQPRDYWYVKVDYGSCSGCDALSSIRDYSSEKRPTEQQVKDYMTLALHIVQGIKKMD